jgi:putative membrane protein
VNDADALEEAVRRAEERTDAEIIVVVCPRSDSWRDVGLAVGGVAAWLGFVGAIALPFDVSPMALVLELPLAAALGAWVGTADALVRRLPTRWTGPRVDRAAAEAFLEEAVHATPGRTGVLLFVSRAERAARVLADVGLEGRVPPVRWAEVAELAADGRTVDAIARLGALLAVAAPAGTGARLELPDAPRMRT